MLKVLQLSDTHLYADRNTLLHGLSTQESLEKLLAKIKPKIKSVDAIILSGDVSQDRSAQSYVNIAKTLQDFKKPVYWFAGNHDDPRVMRDTLQQFNTFHLLASLTLGSWQFLALDTVLEGSNAGYLVENNESLILENTFCALLMHHHPTSVGADSIDKYKLQNPEVLERFLSQQKKLPTVIITGHVHGAYQTSFATIPVISSPATCFQFPKVAPNLEVDPIGGCTFWKFHDDGTFEYEYVYNENVNYKGLSLRIHDSNHKTHLWFIHGFGETGDSFSAVKNNLDVLANYSIRIPDLPGCGKSNALSFDSIEDTAQLLVESINEFSPNEDIILVAHSMGTLIGEKITEKLSKRVKLFISIEGFLIQYKERFSSTILQYDDPLQFYDAFVKKISGANAGAVSETYLDHILSCTPQALYTWAKSCYAMTSNYINLKCKLVYMCGTKSAYKPELELLQSASIDIIQFDNCGHWVMHDASNFYDEVFRLCSTVTAHRL